MHLAKRLNEELANQAMSGGRSRAISPEPEPRAKSYENKSPQNKGNGKWQLICSFETNCVGTKR